MFKIDFLRTWNPIVVVIFCVIGCVPALIGGLAIFLTRPIKTGRLMKKIGIKGVAENLLSSANMTGFIFIGAICNVVGLIGDGFAFIGGKLFCSYWRHSKLAESPRA